MRTPRTFPCLALFLVVSLAGCGGGGGGDDNTTTMAGTVLFVPKSPMLHHEEEPNDSVDQRPQIGEIALGSTLELSGEIGTSGDVLDAFALVAPERVRISATLVPAAGADAREFQLAVYDPVAMQVVERAAGGTLQFHARGAFDVVVRAARGSGAYTLRVRAEPAALERDGWLGGIAAGDVLALPLSNGSRTWTATSLEAQTLVVRTNGASVRVLDGESVLLAEGSTELRVELAALARVSIEASSPAPVTIEVRSEAATRRAPARTAPLARESISWNATASDPLYGRTQLEARPAHLLVRARNGADLTPELERRGCREVRVIPDTATLVEIDLPADLDLSERARATLAIARSFEASPLVEFAALDLIRRPLGNPDPLQSLQWHYPLIQLPEAWNVFTGASTTVVAVIDTGRRDHPDLDANTIDGYDMISDSTVAADGGGRDEDETDVGDSEGPTPSSFHGTHVAGTIAAVTNNGVGVAGVCGPANRTRVKHVRVLGKGGGFDSDIADAIRHAAGLTVTGVPVAAPVDVINLSLGGPGANPAVQLAVNAAFGAGVTIFAAAGNNNSGVAFFPAAFTNVISISAVDINANKAPYSNFHATVDLCAPGGDVSVDLNQDTYADGVLSTLVNEPAHDPIYVFYQGTSMACPHAAGVAALMLSQNDALLPAQIEQFLEDSAVDRGAPGPDPIFGVGLIDAHAALLLAQGGGPMGPPEIDVAPATLAFGTETLSLNFQIQNIGGMVLDVTDAVNPTIGGPDGQWISSIQLVNTGDPTTNFGRAVVTVNRNALPADGMYTADIVVNSSNGGSAVVQVTISRVPVVMLPNVPIFLLLLNSETFEAVAQIDLNPNSELDYAFTGIPPGNYVLVCGSDEDDDDIICSDGDVYCGGYPTLNELEVLSVAGGVVTGLNFVVAPIAQASGTGAPQRGFRLLHP